MNNNIADKPQEPILEPLRNDIQLIKVSKEKDNADNWLLFDPVADKYFRIGSKEHLIISFFAEPLTPSQLLLKVTAVEPSITSNDVNSVIQFLQMNGLLKLTPQLTEAKINRTRAFREKNRFNVFLQSYLFFRIPLFKPDKFLNETLYIIKALFNKWFIMLLGLTALAGYVLLVMHWQKFEANIIGSLNYSGVIKYSIAIIFLKVIHEFSHAYTAKMAGIRVRRFGIGFIVFFPRFYTDITDSWRIKEKSRKILIDAAGILAELTIGGIAVIFWIYSQPGIVQTIAYYVFAVSIINTVLVNGNPFIRYDGYYILMDFIGIDNLQNRSRMLISQLFREKLFGIKTYVPFKFEGWQKTLIIIYGISGFIYRIFLYTGIILIVYYKFTKIVGIILVILEIYLLVYKPLQREISAIMKSFNKANKKHVLITISGVSIFLLIFFAPLPWTVSLPCIVGSAKDKIIYVKSPGFIKNINNSEKNYVTKETTLLELSNPYLLKEKRILEKKLQVRETELDQLKSISKANIREPLKSKIEQIENIENSIAEHKRKIQQLNIKSSIDGIFVLFDWHLKPGKWLDYGVPVGEVFSDKDLVVYAYAEEKYADSFKLGEDVNFYLDDSLQSFSGKIIRINPVPTKEWQPSPLLDVAGGPLQVLKKESLNTYLLKNYYYQITIEPDKYYKNLKFSRTGDVQVKKYSSTGLNFIRTIISTIMRELSF